MTILRRNRQGGSVIQGSSGVTPTSLEMSLENRNNVLSTSLGQIPRGISSGPPPPPSASQIPFIPMSSRNNMYGSLYPYTPKLPQVQQPPPPVYPIQPDVRLKRLPFYEVLGELLKPSSLVPVSTQREQSTTFVFYLTPTQASDVAMNREVGPSTKNEYPTQVQMRFCLLETSCEQEDVFPPGIVVKVNGKLCPLPNPIPINRPNVEPKRPPRPVNISNWCKLCPSVANQVAVSWTPEYSRGYVITINVVKKLTANDLLQKMKSKGVRHSDFTTGLIKEKLSEDADSEIATTSLRVSLICPLGKQRMTVPCRPSTCTHLQCFDASLFLQMNEKKPTWACPVCDKPAAYDNLVIDGYFQTVLTSNLLPADCHEIQLHKDGSWTGQATKKESTTVGTPAKMDPIEEIIDDLDETSQSEIKTEEIKTEQESMTVSGGADKTAAAASGKLIFTVDLTCSDSEDDDPGRSNRDQVTSQQEKATSSPKSGPNETSRIPHANGISDSSSSGGRNSSSPSIITLDSPSPPPRVTSPPTFDSAFMDLTQMGSNGENAAAGSPTVSLSEQPPSVPSPSTTPSLPLAPTNDVIVPVNSNGSAPSPQLYQSANTVPQYNYVRLPQGSSRYHPY